MGYQEKKDLVLREIKQSMDMINAEEAEKMVHMICAAEQVFVVGVGRVLLMMKAFVKRLNHLGISANYVGAVNEPAITERDVLIVGSGSGESVVPLEIMKIAKCYQAKIIHIGSNQHSSMRPYEDLFVRIPCSTKLHQEDEIESEQIMSSLFEQSLLLLGDAAAIMIAEEKEIKDIHALWKMHANLE